MRNSIPLGISEQCRIKAKVFLDMAFWGSAPKSQTTNFLSQDHTFNVSVRRVGTALFKGSQAESIPWTQITSRVPLPKGHNLPRDTSKYWLIFYISFVLGCLRELTKHISSFTTFPRMFTINMPFYRLSIISILIRLLQI